MASPSREGNKICSLPQCRWRRIPGLRRRAADAVADAGSAQGVTSFSWVEWQVGSSPQAETRVQLSQLRCCSAKRIFVSQRRLRFLWPQTITVPLVWVCLRRAPQGGSARPSPRLCVSALPVFSPLTAISCFYPSPVAHSSSKLSYSHNHTEFAYTNIFYV